MPAPPQLAFTEVHFERDAEAAATFLSQNTWPFHASSTLTIDEARQVRLSPPDQVRAFWISENSAPVGIIRAFDLEHAGTGSVLFDLRIAGQHRGRGIGRAAVAWIVDRLFADYPSLHRIEAATRIDNQAMRRALESNQFRLEGQLRQTWSSDHGTRYDTALYGRLRTDG